MTARNSIADNPTSMGMVVMVNSADSFKSCRRNYFVAKGLEISSNCRWYPICYPHTGRHCPHCWLYCVYKYSFAVQYMPLNLNCWTKTNLIAFYFGCLIVAGFAFFVIAAFAIASAVVLNAAAVLQLTFRILKTISYQY